MTAFFAAGLVGFYRFWHGTLHLPGAGKLLQWFSRRVKALQHYPLQVPWLGTMPIDFRMDYAFIWTNFLLNEPQHTEGLLTVLKKYASPQMVFWDIGANIGLISGNLYRSFPSATFCLFEPNPDLTQRLVSLFSAHPNAHIVEAALSDRNARGQFSIVPGESGTATLLPTGNAEAVSVEVKLLTGDQYLAEHPSFIPRLIKIDVEGHEVEALRGCRELIAQHRPVIVFEHLFLTDEAIRYLVPAHYEISYIHDVTGECSPVLDRRCSHNALLIPAQS